MAPEYHHKFLRNMIVTLDNYKSYMSASGGQLATPACISHDNIYQQWDSQLSRYMCITWFSRIQLSNITNTLNTEVFITRYEKKGNMNDPLETANFLFRALNILTLGLMIDWQQGYQGQPSQDLYKGVDEDQRLPKDFFRLKVKLRTEQRQNEDISKTKKAIKRTYEDKPRTSRGQKMTCEGPTPNEIAMLPNFVFNISIPILFWHKTFLVAKSEIKTFSTNIIFCLKDE